MSTALAVRGGGFIVQPANLAELKDFCLMLSNSELAPKDYAGKPANCLIAIQMGAELGLSPMQAIQNIAVINGRPSLWGDAMLAVCLPHLDELEESFDDATMTATCRAKRGKRAVTNTFSKADADLAGLWGKAGPWKTYPKRMLKTRARGFCLRDACADVLRGIISAEEVSDYEVRPDPKPETKPVGPVFWLGWPDKQWAGKLIADADSKTICDYIEYLSQLIEDPKRVRLKDGASKSRDVAQKVIDDRMAAEAEKALAIADAKRAQAPDPIADKLQDIVDGVEDNDTNESWGLTPA